MSDKLGHRAVPPPDRSGPRRIVGGATGLPSDAGPADIVARAFDPWRAGGAPDDWSRPWTNISAQKKRAAG